MRSAGARAATAIPKGVEPALQEIPGACDRSADHEAGGRERLEPRPQEGGEIVREHVERLARSRLSVPCSQRDLRDVDVRLSVASEQPRRGRSAPRPARRGRAGGTAPPREALRAPVRTIRPCSRNAEPSPVPSVIPIARSCPRAAPAHHSPRRNASASFTNRTCVGASESAAASSAAQVDPVERLELVLEQADPARVVERPRHRDTHGHDVSVPRGCRRVAEAGEELLPGRPGDELRAHVARRDDGRRADVDRGRGHVRPADVERDDGAESLDQGLDHLARRPASSLQPVARRRSRGSRASRRTRGTCESPRTVSTVISSPATRLSTWNLPRVSTATSSSKSRRSTAKNSSSSSPRLSSANPGPRSFHDRLLDQVAPHRLAAAGRVEIRERVLEVDGPQLARRGSVAASRRTAACTGTESR